jgi:uncharacterized membrane protein
MNDTAPHRFSSDTRRWPMLDSARGIAIVAMIAFHFTWDLGFFGIVDYDISFAPEGRLFAHLIAGSFLTISGISLALATRSGFRPRLFLRRFRWLVCAALLVSLGTLIAMPGQWIFFGILHCIALSSLLALPFLQAPLAFIGVVALGVIAAPFVIAHPFFDQPWLFFLGLNHVMPDTNDYVPLFPYCGIVLLGLAFGRFALTRSLLTDFFTHPCLGFFSRRLARLGRFSLAVYLIHQPVMMAALWGLLALTGPLHFGPARDTAFIRACVANCVQKGSDATYCDKTCTCVGESLAELSRTASQQDQAEFSRRIDTAIAVCRAASASP